MTNKLSKKEHSSLKPDSLGLLLEDKFSFAHDKIIETMGEMF